VGSQLKARHILKVSGISKSRDGFPVLERLGMDLSLGQTCCLISDSRDKLSLLIEILGGAERQDEGYVFLGEDPVRGQASGNQAPPRPLSPRERLDRCGIVRERPALVEKLTVLDNVFLGSMGRWSRFGLVSESRIRRRAAETLKFLELQASLDSPLESLNPASRILVDIARVLVKDGDLYVFDSVTRAMSARQYEAFAQAVQGLKARGRAVIVVPVGAEDVRAFADRLFILKGPLLSEIERPRDLGEEELNGLFLHGEKKSVQHVNDPIYRARARIEELMGEGDIDFRAIAGSVFMSYDNFRRKFKNQTGLSPNQYFIKLKVEKAKELLLFTDLEIKEIAESLGFSDPYYFSRVFKEWEGSSPVKFRKEEAP
jgi:ABC-type sugar transport system ATPase subunit